ncbi:MAG: hypothetical protein AB7Q17_00920 [Phycisphaerae bacterium]
MTRRVIIAAFVLVSTASLFAFAPRLATGGPAPAGACGCGECTCCPCGDACECGADCACCACEA